MPRKPAESVAEFVAESPAATPESPAPGVDAAPSAKPPAAPKAPAVPKTPPASPEPSPRAVAEAQVLAKPLPPKDKKGKLEVAADPGKTLSTDERLKLILGAKPMKEYAKKHPAQVAEAEGFKSVVPRIALDMVAVDLMLRGGLPTGVQHHWFGPKACGKTTLLLWVIGKAQKLCSNCYRAFDTPNGCCDHPRRFIAAVLNPEGFIDWKWAAALGVDRSALLYSMPETAEQTLDAYEALLATNEVDLVGIDSIAQMIPASELGKAADEADPGTHARHVHRLIRKTASYLNQMSNKTGRRATPIFINQNRMKIGVMFGNPETTAGGLGPGYGAGVELRFGSSKIQKDNTDPTGDPLYVTLFPKVEKTKLFPGKGAEAEVTLLQRDTTDQKLGEVMDAPQLVELGLKAGLIEGEAPSMLCLGKPFRGKSVIEQELMKNRELSRELRDGILKVMVRG